MSREGLADLIASLTQPNVAARYRDVRGVAVGPSPVSTAHRDRWRARVKRTKDTGRLRFTERGVHLANNLAVSWNARGAANPMLWLVLDVVARYPDPQTALEMLREHRLWPWAPGDIDAPRWFCEMCSGTGGVSWRGEYGRESDWCGSCGRDDLDATGGVTADGTTADPPSLAALVAVASRGPATLRRVAELVRELHAVTQGETGATLVWRVTAREKVREHHAKLRAKLLDTSDTVAQAFSTEENLRVYGETEHNRALAWRVSHPYERDAVRAAYPILRALAVHEDGKTPTGLHLVTADRTRVVIAVEALG